MIPLVPVRVRKSKCRCTSYSILNYFKISAPEVPVKPILKHFSSLFYFTGITPEMKEDAGFCKYDGHEYEVYINSELSGGVDNFAYAHELGHIVLGHFTDYDTNSLSESHLWILNREADVFATNFLMPEHMMRSYIQFPLTVQSIGHYKDMFGVSWCAFINRLDELQIFPKIEADKLFASWRNNKQNISMNH